jgi:hypothetical protein
MYKLQTTNLITRLQRASNSIGNRVENNDWYDYITAAIRELKSGRTLPWQNINYEFSFYTDLVKNALPSDFNSFIKPSQKVLSGQSYDLRIEGNYSSEKEFRNSSEVMFSLMFERDKKYLLSRYPGKKDSKIDDFNDSDITYTESGDVSNLEIDSNDFILGNGSLIFDITDSTNTFTISRTIDEIDITDFLREGIASVFVKMPSVLQDITLKLGNDSSNYYSITATEQFTGDDFVVGWNVIKFDFNSKTEVGSVNNEEISWFEISGDNTGASGLFKLNGLYLRIPSILEFPYNSKNVVETATGTGIYQEKVDDGVNMIIWEEDFEDLLLFKVLEKSGFFNFRDIDLVQKSTSDYQYLLSNFNARYPSNEEGLKTRYYKRFNQF